MILNMESYIASEIDLVTGERIWYETYQDLQGNWWKQVTKIGEYIDDGGRFDDQTGICS